MRRLKRILGGSYVIGNVMRRVLEGYSSFNFGMGIDALSRDPEPLGAKGARVDSLAIAAGGLPAKGRLSFETGVFGAVEPPKAARRALWGKNKNSKP